MGKQSEVKKPDRASLKASDFVHLHNHTHYSLLDGLTKVPNLVNQVKDMGMEAVAITDHGTMSGAIELYKEATAAQIKPLIGMETYIAARKHTDKEAGTDKANNHLILIAMNNEGYQNLMELSTIANLEGFYYKARIDHDLLRKYNGGLICLSACLGGEVSSALKDDNYEQAVNVAKMYKDIFGDRYYLELQDHDHELQIKVNESLLRLGKELDIPCVVTADAHYLKHEDQDAHEILLCVQTGSFLDEEKRMSLTDFDLHVSSPEEIIARWGDKHPELITNTKAIADRCNVTIELDKILIPKFELPKGVTEKDQLELETFQGLANRVAKIPIEKSKKMSIADVKKLVDKEYIERAEYELGIINRMGFDGYFLITADFIVWGKNRGIVFGPGRGSAAGSIVSYCMYITDLDPLEYDLLFERFLNPDRISMPDIDIDIQDSRRDEVIEYVVEKYGQENVAHIITFGKMAARNAIRDVSRVLRVPYGDADRMAKLVPPPVQGRHIPLETSLVKDQDLKSEYDNNDDAKRVMDQAVKLEGTIRSHGVHAAGVVIAPDKITQYTPLEMSQKGVVTTQYSMGPVEELGLLKMDFLGLSNLTIINNTLRIVKKVYKKDLEIADVPLDDKKTFELLSRGDTTGTFQLESDGMKRYIKELQPDKFDDIIAMVALYRPGPLTAGYVDKFVARKVGKEKTIFDNKHMEEALSGTYGVLVYQEQVMSIARNMAGFTGGEADNLRKAVAKKKRDVMAKIKADFIKGSVEHGGVTAAYVEKFWSDLEGFADYAFPKAHSACYGMIAYWTAYLKANFPDAYMAALMTSNYDDTDRLTTYIDECRNMGIEVLAPDVNESFPEFAIVPKKNQIRFGMAAIKNVGQGAAEAIVSSRQEKGLPETLEEFLTNTDYHSLNKKTLESLIKAGALDRFGDRVVLYNNSETLVKYASNIQKHMLSAQASLFGGGSDAESFGSLELEEKHSLEPGENPLIWEKELLGVYISAHPLNKYHKYLKEKAAAIVAIAQVPDDSSIDVGGQIRSVKEIITKKGSKMAFIQLEDINDVLELVCFPEVYNEFQSILTVNSVVIATGKVSSRGNNGEQGEKKILLESIRQIDETTANNYKSKKKPYELPKSSVTKDVRKSLYVNLVDRNNRQKLEQIKNIFNNYPGDDNIILVLGKGEDKTALRLPFKTDMSNAALHSEMVGLLGDGSVIVK